MQQFMERILGTPPAIAVAPSPPPYVPPAVIDLRFAGTGAATIDIPGYVSVPQGRVSLDNPRNLDVRISGGVLASQILQSQHRDTETRSS